MDWTWFHRLASPPHIYRVAGTLTPWFAWPAGVLILGALYAGLFLAPPDYQQGEGFRMIYVHAPSAWLSVMIYGVMATAAAVGLIWRMKVAHAAAASCAAIGASFTAVSLLTGMLWGKPMWGTYWLRSGIDDIGRADRASAVLAIVGVVNLPIIRYSVEWWNSIHQTPSVMKMARPSMPVEMLAPLLMMLAGFTLYFAAVLLVRLRAEVLRRERGASWIKEAVS
jgi:heme exporter protein C